VVPSVVSLVGPVLVPGSSVVPVTVWPVGSFVVLAVAPVGSSVVPEVGTPVEVSVVSSVVASEAVPGSVVASVSVAGAPELSSEPEPVQAPKSSADNDHT
jgi:hypothetical protein